MESLFDYADIYWHLGLNVVACHNRVTAQNMNSNDILKSPGYDYFEYFKERQSRKTLEDINWSNACSVGAITGYENLMTIDIDGCFDEKFISFVLEKLGLEKNYEWVFRTGSQTGYQILIRFEHNYKLEYGNIKWEEINTYAPNDEYRYIFNKIEILRYSCAILPPSLHTSGLQYKFLNCRVPKFLPRTVESINLLRLIELVAKSQQVNLSSANNFKIESDKPYHISDLPKKVGRQKYKNVSFTDFINNYGELYLIFNLETKGYLRKEDMPDILQIAWALMDGQGTILKRKSSLIYPTNSSHDKKNDGIDLEIRKTIGSELKYVLSDLINDIKIARHLVTHNMYFYLKILNYHLEQNNLDRLSDQKSFICTMKEGSNYLSKNGLGSGKQRELKQLYSILFDSNINEYYNAVYDVALTAKIFSKIHLEDKHELEG